MSRKKKCKKCGRTMIEAYKGIDKLKEIYLCPVCGYTEEKR